MSDSAVLYILFAKENELSCYCHVIATSFRKVWLENVSVLYTEHIYHTSIEFDNITPSQRKRINCRTSEKSYLVAFSKEFQYQNTLSSKILEPYSLLHSLRNIYNGTFQTKRENHAISVFCMPSYQEH